MNNEVPALLVMLALVFALFALAGCAAPFTFAPAGHQYDPLLAAAVRAELTK